MYVVSGTTTSAAKEYAHNTGGYPLQSDRYEHWADKTILTPVREHCMHRARRVAWTVYCRLEGNRGDAPLAGVGVCPRLHSASALLGYALQVPVQIAKSFRAHIACTVPEYDVTP